MWIGLGLIFIGFVMLYTATKDRWNWGRFGSLAWRVIAALIVIPVVILIIVLANDKLESNARKNQEIEDAKPKALIGWYGVELGEKLADVKFKIATKKMDSSKITNSPEVDVYAIAKDDQGFGQNFIEVDSTVSKVEAIFHVCKYDGTTDYASLNGIACGSSGDSIVDRYGVSKTKILCGTSKELDAAVVRYYFLPDFNIYYTVVRNKVTDMSILRAAFFNKEYASLKPCDQIVGK